MLVRDVLGATRTVFTARTARRAGLVASLVFAERLLTAAVAWVFFQGTDARRFAVAVVLAGAFVLRTWLQQTLRAHAEAELFHRIVKALLDGDVLEMNVLTQEDARTELAQAVFRCAQALSHEMPALLADAVAAAVLGLVLLAVEPAKLALLAVGVALLGAFALLSSRRRLQHKLDHAWRAQDRVLDAFVDALEGRVEIVASGLREAFVSESERRTYAWASASLRVSAASLLSGKLPLLAIGAGVASAIAASSTLRASLPFDLADFALLAAVSPAFAGVGQGVQALGRSERWVVMVAETIRKGRVAPSRAGQCPIGTASIDVQGVSFRYDDDGSSEDVLRNVSFQCVPGSVLALTGLNGSGKSTCLRLLVNLARPSAGVIRIGGVDLREIDRATSGTSLAFLPQRPYLPARSSVGASIRLLAPGASDERIRAALKRVGLLATLERAAGGPLEVPVDGLSAGQRQRIAIARVLCRDASLFVLDEPDANLDRAGVTLVADLVRELSTRGTVVFAAHADDLLVTADQILVFENGTVVAQEFGPQEGRSMPSA